MTTFVLATHNEGKRRELLAILLPALGRTRMFSPPPRRDSAISRKPG